MADLSGILARLLSAEVDFVVVGGFAAVAHGSPLLTMDLDICCDMAAENLLKLGAALTDLHPVHRMTPRRLPLVLNADTCRRGFKNLYLDTDWGQLDCLGTIAGLGDYQAVKEQSELLELGSGLCRVLSLDGLIKAKEAMGRPRDEECVRQLKAIRERVGKQRRKQRP